MVIVVLPVYNEERVLEQNFRKLHAFLQSELSDDWRIVIADNASTDSTSQIARGLARQFANTSAMRGEQKGRGIALRRAWEAWAEQGDVFSYMDVDLATDIAAFPDLCQAVKDGADIAIGSRYLSSSAVHRSGFRDRISVFYNLILRRYLRVRFSDGQCGFKAINRKVLAEVVPRVQDNYWFFDTELLALAETAGYIIKELPVHWVETRNKYRQSKVKVIPTILDYLKRIYLLKKRLADEKNSSAV